MSARHNALRDALADELRRRGYDVLTEERVPRGLDGPGYHQIDVLARHPGDDEWLIVEAKTRVPGRGGATAATRQVCGQAHGLELSGRRCAGRVVVAEQLDFDRTEAAIRHPDVTFVTADEFTREVPA